MVFATDFSLARAALSPPPSRRRDRNFRLHGYRYMNISCKIQSDVYRESIYDIGPAYEDGRVQLAAVQSDLPQLNAAFIHGD